MRGGVPVFKRPCGRCNSFNRAASEMAAGLPPCRGVVLHADVDQPVQDVPAVSTTSRYENDTRLRDSAADPAALEQKIVNRLLNRAKLRWVSSCLRIAFRYNTRSA